MSFEQQSVERCDEYSLQNATISIMSFHDEYTISIEDNKQFSKFEEPCKRFYRRKQFK